jgi:putative tryptophan/tyrosine transport system substrate-binding protein
MRRRDVIRLLGGVSFGGAAATLPLAARAQQPTMPRVGVLSSRASDDVPELMAAFREGLKETGYVEGRNVAFEFRWAGGYDRLPEMAADLVRRQVAVIVAVGGVPSARAAKAATATIPVVFGVGADPVALGIVASLKEPGGNLTGVTNFNLELGQKRLELVREVLPGAKAVALLVNPNTPLAEPLAKDSQAAARTFGLDVHVLQAASERDIDDVFANLIQMRVDALVIGADAYFSSRSAQFAALAIRYALPTVGSFRDFAVAGGLMSYGGSLADQFHWVGVYTGRILAGAKPADLPVQQSTKVELIVNQKAAKTLDLTLPLALLGRADEVIE